MCRLPDKRCYIRIKARGGFSCSRSAPWKQLDAIIANLFAVFETKSCEASQRAGNPVPSTLPDASDLEQSPHAMHLDNVLEEVCWHRSQFNVV